MSETHLLVPRDRELYPTLGPEVVDWIEANLVHGPGDVLGEPVELTPEAIAFVFRCYEVWPHGHARAGRRRFRRAVLSRRKGWAKTELAAFLVIAEMDPTCPVRFDGWRQEEGQQVPVGRPVRDPYIPMIATTEEQTEDLAYAAVREILERSQLAAHYDVGLDRIKHTRAPGIIRPLAGMPSARDGALTTFVHFDETHLFIRPRLRSAHRTMLRALAKRKAAEPWALETTTAYGPGEGSVGEDAHQYAREVEAQLRADPDLLYDHRQAAERWQLERAADLRKAIEEASGDAIDYADVDAILGMFRDPTQSDAERRRYWLNQPRVMEEQYLDVEAVWDPLTAKRRMMRGTRVVLGFDGSYNRDSTVLLAATVEEHPHLSVLKAWEKPLGLVRPWRVPRRQVIDAVADAMERFEVVEFAPDPPGWVGEIEAWEETYGEIVQRFETKQPSRMGPACDEFHQAVLEKRITHDGSEILRRHLGNCITVDRAGWKVVTKSAPDSPNKIDAAVGAIVAHARAAWHYHNPEPEDDDVGVVVVDVAAEIRRRRDQAQRAAREEVRT